MFLTAQNAIGTHFQPENYTRKKVTVVVPDQTRPISYERVLPPVLSRLQSCSADVTIFVALGLHRPMTTEEKTPLLDLAERFGATVVEHDPCLDTLIQVGGDPLACFHPAVVKTERLLLVGVVELHQYAGFSGGVKSLSIGAASQESIERMHGFSYLCDDRACIGRIEDNPFQDRLWALAHELPAKDALQVVYGDAPTYFFGPARQTFLEATKFAETQLFEEHKKTVQWVLVELPEVKGKNFYQASSCCDLPIGRRTSDCAGGRCDHPTYGVS